MKCTLWTETLEFWRWKMPNSRFALHGLAPPSFTVCAPFLPLIHGWCAFFRPLLTPVLTAPSLPASQFTVLHFTVYAPSILSRHAYLLRFSIFIFPCSGTNGKTNEPSESALLPWHAQWEQKTKRIDESDKRNLSNLIFWSCSFHETRAKD